MTLWSRLIDRITPAWLKRQEAEAEAGLAAAREQYAEVTKRDKVISQQARAHRLDLRRNHYADRVAAAYAGKEHL
jgi:hypothetical protein